MRGQWGRRLLFGSLLAVGTWGSGAAAAEADQAAGERLVRLANCGFCHSSAGDQTGPLGGGVEIRTWFGVQVAPNITPDPIYGIGTWTRDGFARAVLHGRSPDGVRYQSVFPTDAYARMRRTDLDAIFDYLTAQPAAARPVSNSRSQALPTPSRFLQVLDRWRLPGHSDDRRTEDIQADTGAYLVEAVGHCGQCHTPRDAFGRQDHTRRFAGSTRPLYGGGKAPNITPDPKTGIGGWSEQEIADYLETGTSPEFRDAEGSMATYIHKGLKVLTAEERLAIARYLLKQPPWPSEIPGK